MQPSRLDLDANSSSASKEWCHWFVTFEKYIEVLGRCITGGRTTDEQAKSIGKLRLAPCVRIYR